MESLLHLPISTDMVRCMKTTVELPDELLDAAKSVAARDKTTLRSLLEEGLRWVLARRGRRKQFRLRDASVAGKGVQDGIEEGSWDQILDLSYRGRGT